MVVPSKEMAARIHGDACFEVRTASSSLGLAASCAFGVGRGRGALAATSSRLALVTSCALGVCRGRSTFAAAAGRFALVTSLLARSLLGVLGTSLFCLCLFVGRSFSGLCAGRQSEDGEGTEEKELFHEGVFVVSE